MCWPSSRAWSGTASTNGGSITSTSPTIPGRTSPRSRNRRPGTDTPIDLEICHNLISRRVTMPGNMEGTMPDTINLSADALALLRHRLVTQDARVTPENLETYRELARA